MIGKVVCGQRESVITPLLNRGRAHQLMDAHALGALVASSPENVAYTSGFHSGLFNRPQRDRLTFVIIPRDETKPSAMIIPHYYLSYLADRPLDIDQIWTYGYYHITDSGNESRDAATSRFRKLLATTRRVEDGVTGLARALEELGLADSRIGIDESDLAFPAFSALEERLSTSSRLVHASKLFQQIRMIKTEHEVALLRESTRITEEAMLQVIGAIKPGVTERDLEQIFRQEVVSRGAHFTFACMPAGFRSAFPACQTSDYSIGRGDLVKLDAGCMFGLYHSDIGRTVVVGEPNYRQEKLYEAMWAGTREAVKSVRPGIAASALFNLAMAVARESGIENFRRHHCGHGQGLEGYEPPLIAPHDTTLLQPGMVLNIETPFNEAGFGGMIVEETVLVTEEGYEQLTTIGSELYVV